MFFVEKYKYFIYVLSKYIQKKQLFSLIEKRNLCLKAIPVFPYLTKMFSFSPTINSEKYFWHKYFSSNVVLIVNSFLKKQNKAGI